MSDLSTEPFRAPIIRERTGPRRFWTAREEKLLRENYPVGGIKACRDLFPGRTLSSIYQHAFTIGLKTHPGEFSYQRWSTSPHIDEIIRRTYQGVPRKNMVADLAKMLGRPRWWVSKRAAALGFVAPRFKEQPWGEAELRILEDNAHKPFVRIQKILERQGFKRTETAVGVKVKRLGIDRADPDHFTATALAKVMGIDAKGVTRWIDKGWLPAKKRGTERTEIQGGDMWWIKRKDIRRFIIDNAAMVDHRKVDKFWLIDLLANVHG